MAKTYGNKNEVSDEGEKNEDVDCEDVVEPIKQL